MTGFRICALSALVSIGLSAYAGAAIQDIYTGGAGTYTFSGTVTAILDEYPTTGTPTKNTFVISDNTGSVLAYSIPFTTYQASVGDQVTVTAKNTPYSGAPELVSTGFSASVTGTTTVTPTSITASQLVGSSGSTPLAQAYVSLSNVSLVNNDGTPVTSLAFSVTGTNSTYHIIDSSDSSLTAPYAPTGVAGTFFVPKSTTYSNVTSAVNAANANPSIYSGPLNITGFVNDYNGQLELEPLSITAAPEPASLSLLAGAGLLALRRRRA